MYKRTLVPVIKEISKDFPVLLLTGPRQVGKTYLLKNMLEPGRRYVSLDDMDARRLAKTDPALFMQTYKPPVMIDEVQYAPELFTQIKIYVDSHKKAGQVWLTGSQKFRLMEGIQESLAGRVAIIDMLGLSRREILNRPGTSLPFLPSKDWIGKTSPENNLTVLDVYRLIWEGSFPKLLSAGGRSRKIFYRSYVQTYIERDVKDFYNIRDELQFYRFLRAAAARTGNLLNYNDLARDVNIDIRTAKLWLSILRRSGLVVLLEPYFTNITKRMVKTPKLYFLDTGLCAYLTEWDSPQTLEAGAMSGAILETWVFSEILKSYWHNGDEPLIYFYRDHDQQEIDFIIERNGRLFPVEVKKTAAPSKADLKNFDALKKTGKPVGNGAVLCFYPGYMPINRETTALPVWEI
jgi:predicted AAA+ superfamily ATPase